MGSTAGGLPYPEPTGQVKAGAADIKALADAVEIRAPKKIFQHAGGYTTNQYGDIRIGAGPISVVEGAVANYVGGVPIFVVISPQGQSPTNTVGFSFFNDAGGKVANTFVIVNCWVWGR